MNDTLYIVLFVIMFILGILTFSILLLFIIRLVFWLTKRKTFPRKSLTCLLMSIIIFLFIFYNHYYNLNYLPNGELNATIDSPDGKNRIETYHFSKIYGENAKAVLVNNDSGDRKTIYFNWYDFDPKVVWESNEEVKIGRETLNIYTDHYDYRHDENLRLMPPQRN